MKLGRTRKALEEGFIGFCMADDPQGDSYIGFIEVRAVEAAELIFDMIMDRELVLPIPKCLVEVLGYVGAAWPPVGVDVGVAAVVSAVTLSSIGRAPEAVCNAQIFVSPEDVHSTGEGFVVAMHGAMGICGVMQPDLEMAGIRGYAVRPGVGLPAKDPPLKARKMWPPMRN